MNEVDKVYSIIKLIDYDMYKEAKAEPDEWEEVISGIGDILIDVYNEGYAEAENEYNIYK